MGDSDGSWPSGCPEKYWWIGGDEPVEPWYAHYAQHEFVGESSAQQEVQSTLNLSNAENVPPGRLPLAEVRQPMQAPPALENPRIVELERLTLDLTSRLFEVEAREQRHADELNRVTTFNDQLIGQLADLSSSYALLWAKHVATRTREKRNKWMCVVVGMKCCVVILPMPSC